MKEKISKLWPALALTALLIGLSGCGSNVSAQPPGGPESRPDRLKIEIDDSVDP
ncbi:MAG: hypothetical protein IMW89_10850, partial [Ktedonobacteraceae bacterium]|nr:hypothetical protein [Ktedonobacteraceae bacterium]